MNTNIENFKSALKERVVEFEFIKKDGTIRKAKGTNKIELIPESQLSTGTGRKYTENPNVTKYFDIEKEGWRSFNNENFKSFE